MQERKQKMGGSRRGESYLGVLYFVAAESTPSAPNLLDSFPTITFLANTKAANKKIIRHS